VIYPMKSSRTIVLLALLLSAAWLPRESFAQVFFTIEHVDLGLAEGTGLGLHWHDEDNGLEYAPHEAVAFIDPVEAKLVRPAGSTWDFLGMSAGQDVWILPQTANPSLPFLGVGAEDAAPGTFDLWNPGDLRGASLLARWLELSLVSFSGPGAFSIYTTNGFGVPTVWMSTFATPGQGNALFVPEGGHSHFNWAFSAEGTYHITFQVRGFVGGSAVTEQAVFTFTTVPEPRPIGLILLLAGGGLAWRCCARREVLRERRGLQQG
jgi:surface-anchored protein